MSTNQILEKAEIDFKEVKRRLKAMTSTLNSMLKGDESKSTLEAQINDFREYVNNAHENVEQIKSHLAGGGGGLELKPTKKPRKEMTPEEKEALVERLRAGRERKKAEKAASSGEEKPEEAKAKEKKPRKEMTPEQKEALVERLRAGRERKKAVSSDDNKSTTSIN